MTPRHIRQYEERRQWVGELMYYLLDEAFIYKDEEEAERVCERLCHLNLDEGGELMEEDAVKWFKEYVREMLEE